MKTILVDALHTFVIKGEGVFKEMHDLLEKFPNKKIILTNAKEEQMEELGLVNLPYESFTLGFEPPKTDPNYFKKMLDHFNLNAEDVIYFEHDEEALKSAESVGIKTHFYDENKKDLEALEKFLKENL